MSCGCCDGVHTVTPAPVYNRPGLPALSYRVGTHGGFRESMLARLSSRPALAGLTTREPDDPAIALLDCWAVVGDVLTFYQERIANEGYLRTATEQESLTRLGRLVGYTPRPPLGASTYLAYTLDPGATSVIPAGSAAKSVPAQGQLPQTYETSEDLVAHEEWNALAVRRTDPPAINAQNVTSTLARFDVDGTTANLKPGDRLLFLFGASQDGSVRVVKQSVPDFQANRTSVTLVSPAGAPDEFTTARNALLDAVSSARQAPVVTRNRYASAIDHAVLQPLQDAVSAQPAPGPDGVLGWPIVGYLQRLPEEEALARPHADCALETWFDGPFSSLLEKGAALIALAARLARRSQPEVEQLRELARFLVCGRENTCPPPPPCEDPFQATGLVGITPILPALRRAPSRPPRNARVLNGNIEALFRPDSDVHPRLLAAADPRLAPHLDQAWSRQEIAPPPPLSSLQVMRVKATVAKMEPPGQEPPSPAMLWLDAVHEAILPGRPVILQFKGQDYVLHPDDVRQDQLTLTVPDPNHPNDRAQDKRVGEVPVTLLEFHIPLDQAITPADIKGAPLWAHGEELSPLGDPIPGDIKGDTIELAKAYSGLRPGRWLIVAGERTDVPYTSGVPASELAMVAGVAQRVDPGKPGDSVRTLLRLANKLAYTYRRATVTIYGNVVAATQGETRNEILGSGDAGAPNQVFRLRQVLAQTPLTWLAADNPLGAQNSLTARVNGVAWHETDGLVWSGPTEHSYTLRVDIDGGVSVGFGDGVRGARLPSGTENVTATYRTGAGRSGNMPAGTVTQLAARPLGVGAVTNPLPATGGADGDGAGDARVTTPLRMQALDRLVSVRDYADFARARAGIGKASAVKLFDGAREIVHVTIAGIGDVPIDPVSGLFTALEAALVDFGDLGVPVRVAVRDLRLLVLSAGIKLLPDYSWDLVEPAVRAELLTEFGFVARDLGEPAYLSQAIAAIQRVDGVDYADIDVFQAISGDVTPIQLATIVAGLDGVQPCIPSGPAHYEQRRHDVSYRDTLTSIAHRYGVTLDELAAWNPRLSTADLSTVDSMVVFHGLRPAQLAVLSADLPEALILRRIP
jgi:uncharacterized phage protein gp47/JayE